MTTTHSRLIWAGQAKVQTRACLCGTMPEIDPELTFED